jgi:hypothetical protein
MTPEELDKLKRSLERLPPGPYRESCCAEHELEDARDDELACYGVYSGDRKFRPDPRVVAPLLNAAPRLIADAKRLRELERKTRRVTHRDVTSDEIAHVTKLAIDARQALLTPGDSSAPIVRWLMWQEGRGLAVALELLTRDERLRELESALNFLCERDALLTVVGENDDTYSQCPEATSVLEMAKSLGWTPLSVESSPGSGGSDG